MMEPPPDTGAVQFEGAMIDVPVVQRAQNVLAQAAAIRRRASP
jgi:citrate lyase beta subunit